METLSIPPIRLDWSDWVSWNDLKPDARSEDCVRIPNGRPGVYEVKHTDAEECLTIGKASDLRMRIKQGLVKGKTPHSAGDRIRAGEDVTQVVIRWAPTDRPAAAEEELHRQHLVKFGRWPKH